VRSVLRCYKQENFRIQLAVRESPASNDVNTEASAFEAVNRRQPIKIQRSKNS
jgi:hypothetical protein